MAITEFVFPRLNPSPALLQGLKEALPPAAKAAFSDVPGLLHQYRGRIIKAQNMPKATDVEHSGLVILLEWDKVSSFNTFWTSDKFGSFRKAMKPFLLSAVAPDLFSSEKQSRSGGTTTDKYTQYVRVSEVKTADREEVESAWQTLMSGLGGGKKNDFCAWGVQDTTGVFAGMIGWESLEAFGAETEGPSQKLWENLARYGQATSYLLELAK